MLKFDLNSRARRALVEAGFEPEINQEAMAEAQAEADEPVVAPLPLTRDLRHLNWSSIDNSDSRDLDQIEYAEASENDAIRLLVGIADVASYVPLGGAIEKRASLNTTSIYTPPRTFPMLPEQLSQNQTSLLENEDRRGMVIEMIIGPDGMFSNPEVYPAIVRNKARLDYDETGRFLEGTDGSISRFSDQAWLASQLRLQETVACRLIGMRKRAGALTFSSPEPKVIKRNDQIVNLARQDRNKARDLIESFMIAANIASAAFLKSRGWPIVDRVVTVPKRWDRIREIASQNGAELPAEPDQKALAAFLARERNASETHFADLSLAIVKLLGAGEYIIEQPGGPQRGHFGLAVDDYSHSTAPNRRYADLLLQRMLQACLCGAAIPYSNPELEQIALHCTEREHSARKVERFMRKVCAALLLQPRIGQTFRGIVTGASPKGTYARLLDFPAEGKIARGEKGLDVGDKAELRLVRTDPEHGFIDFETVFGS